MKRQLKKNNAQDVVAEHSPQWRELKKLATGVRGKREDVFQLSSGAREAIEERLRDRGEDNTRRSYATGMRLFMAWWYLSYDKPFELPVPADAIKHFIADYSEGTGIKRSDNFDHVDKALVRASFKATHGAVRYYTLKQRLAGLAFYQTNAGHPSPFAYPQVKALMRSARKAAVNSGTIIKHKKKAITATDLFQIAGDGGSVIDIRDRALLMFGFASGGRRRSEIAAATWDNLRLESSEGQPPVYTYTLQRSKTCDVPRMKPVQGAAAQALYAWAKVVMEAEPARLQGPMFRKVHGRIVGTSGLTGHQVARIVKKRAASFGFTAAEIGGHSLRRGFITEGVRQGKSLAAIAELTDHADFNSVLSYVEPSVHVNEAADLLR